MYMWLQPSMAALASCMPLTYYIIRGRLQVRVYACILRCCEIVHALRYLALELGPPRYISSPAGSQQLNGGPAQSDARGLDFTYTSSSRVQRQSC